MNNEAEKHNTELHNMHKIIDTEGIPFCNRENKQHPLKKHMWQGIMFFIVIVSSIVFWEVATKFELVMSQILKCITVLEPIIYGFIIAYLLNPIMNVVERRIKRLLEKKVKNKDKIRIISRSIAILFSLVFAIVIITVLLSLILPEFYMSITNMIKDFPAKSRSFTEWMNNLSLNEQLTQWIEGTISSLINNIEEWAKTSLFDKVEEIFSTVTLGVVGVINIVENFIIGIIVSVYLLASKEKFIGQSKKILYALFKPKKADAIIEFSRESNRIFSGFIVGKLIDSLIIGIIAFVALSIIKMPYTIIVSVIVGVTNIIPFFGPYIGGAICFVLILLTDPKAALIFLVFVIILQQIDGNLIGPKILGESTGLSSFWVIFSILVGSGFFGFIGMLLGVPTFAVIYNFVKKIINNRLQKKKLPQNTDYYHKLDYLNKKNNSAIEECEQ